MEPRDKNSRTAAGTETNRQDILDVYTAGLIETSVLCDPNTLTSTRTEAGFDLPGYKACEILKLFSAFAKLLYTCSWL